MSRNGNQDGTGERCRERARRFARVLDVEDHSATAALLASECVCHAPGATYREPAAILAAYRESGEWARRSLDDVACESHVRPAGESAAGITFVDHLKKDGRAHTYCCEQELVFDAEGRIRRIEHREFPGQQEPMDAFLRAVSLSR